MDMQWYGLAAMAVVLGFAAVGVALIIFWFRSRAEQRLKEFEIRHRVLEKFADSETFVSFAKSEEGRRLLLATPEGARNGRWSWNWLLYVGLLLFALGVGARISSGEMPEGKEPWERIQKQETATYGTLCVCAGLALTASGALSRWLDRR
jgi:hypothetical protein